MGIRVFFCKQKSPLLGEFLIFDIFIFYLPLSNKQKAYKQVHMGKKDKKKSVQEKLQKAIELELATIPPYLSAYYSMRPEINKESAAIIKSVIVEEMLHLTLAANLLIATGGKVALREDNIPHYPLMLEFEDYETFNDREFEVNLAPFSKKTVNVFMQIELPGWQPEDEWLSPKGNFKVEGYTIGQFYESIRKDLLELCEAFGEKEVFTGDPGHQINENYYLSEEVLTCGKRYGLSVKSDR